MEEHSVRSVHLANVDGDFEFLGGEDGVHDGDVGCGEVGRDGEDEDAWVDVVRGIFWGVGIGGDDRYAVDVW